MAQSASTRWPLLTRAAWRWPSNVITRSPKRQSWAMWQTAIDEAVAAEGGQPVFLSSPGLIVTFANAFR